MRIYPNLTKIPQEFKGILLDAYGVFWGGNDTGLLPGAKQAMEQLVANGKIVGILSNTTQLAAKELNKFQLHGLVQGKHFHFLVTSGEVVRSIFLNEQLPFPTPNKKFWVFGGVHPKFSPHNTIFQDSSYTETRDLNDADFVYIGIPHIHGEDQLDPQLFHQQIEQLSKTNKPLVCPNPDQFAHEGNPPRAVVRQGSIAALYEKMGGYVFYIGKPYANAYSMALHHFHQKNISNLNEILMVGDTPETDIRGARNTGICSALTTQTGMMADRIANHGMEKVLQALLSSDQPDFFIGQL